MQGVRLPLKVRLMEQLLYNYALLWLVVIAIFIGGVVLWVVGNAMQRHAMRDDRDRLNRT